MKLLVVIDMQNDFITGVLGNEECRAVVPKVVERMERARREGWKIICTQDVHGEDYLQTGEGRRLPVEHCIRGSLGAELIDEIKEMKAGWEDRDEVFLSESPLEKRAFGSTKLSEVIRKYDPEEIELIGVCTDICVISNAMILRSDYPDIEVSVDASCCAGVTVQSHNNALSSMEGCQIAVKRG
ncbi:MAG: isochorismatase family cysteine hydrolase [Filifactor alocis]|nr:isochorismatase family cysteine hydrolase [Filifactor alocis]